MDIKENKYKIQSIRNLTESTYVIRFDRNNMDFKAGQNLNLGKKGNPEKRDYSIYSGENDEYLEILVKEILKGLVSKQLKRLKPGDEIEVEGPFGFFTLNKADIPTKKFLFVSSGSGIAPFHSIIKSYPGLDYTLLHGISHSNEAYENPHYHPDRYISCTTKDKDGGFYGRVTDYLKQNPPDKETLIYFCGNVNMIYDAFDILKEQGIPSGNLHAEVYF